MSGGWDDWMLHTFSETDQSPQPGNSGPSPPIKREAYAALRTALIGSGVLTMAECETWAQRIVAETQGER